VPEAGRLIICATPIGNLGDVTLRVLEALKSADTVLAEDTRVTRKLFSRYLITTPLERYDEHTAVRTPEVIERIRGGETIALVSDAGTPGISDPGSILVDAAIAADVLVDVLPGAAAVIAALVASGLPTWAFYFAGFLPRKAGDRTRLLASLAPLEATLIFYESPRRTGATLRGLAEAFPGRSGAMARELTKLHEEIVRGPLTELAEQISERELLKGEVVLLVGPPHWGRNAAPAPIEPVDASVVRARVAELMSEGTARTAAVKQVAKETGMSRQDVYDLASRP
jgi:16S rRNA (cytidine1402-2'-O)-methyltransferase